MIPFDLSNIIISIQCGLFVETRGQKMAVRDQTTDHLAGILSSSPTNLSWGALLPTETDSSSNLSSQGMSQGISQLRKGLFTPAGLRGDNF